MIQIIQVPTAAFEIDNKSYIVKAHRFCELHKDEDIEGDASQKFRDKLNEMEQKGYKCCYLHRIWTEVENVNAIYEKHNSKYKKVEAITIWARMIFTK